MLEGGVLYGEREGGKMWWEGMMGVDLEIRGGGGSNRGERRDLKEGSRRFWKLNNPIGCPRALLI